MAYKPAKKKVTTTGSKRKPGGQTKTYTKKGKKKAVLNTNYSGQKEVRQSSGNPRFLDRTETVSMVKTPSAKSLDIYNRKGELKKTLVATNKSGTGMSDRKARKLNNKFRRMSR